MQKIFIDKVIFVRNSESLTFKFILVNLNH